MIAASEYLFTTEHTELTEDSRARGAHGNTQMRNMSETRVATLGTFSQLKSLLYADLARQYELEGRVGVQPSLVRFLTRLLHFRYLPNVICRTSRAAMLAGIPVIPGLLTYLNLVVFGLEVTPKCEIGPGIFFAHPVGCVIGAWSVGSNVTMFQGVTLGARHADMQFRREMRCQIGNGVVLGAGCKVLGPCHIGDNVTVGANSVVLESVAPNRTVLGIPATEYRSRKSSE